MATDKVVLGHLIGECKFYEKKCLEKQDASVLQAQVGALELAGAVFFQNTLQDDSFNHLFFMATEVDYTPEAQEVLRYSLIDDHYMRWLRLLRAKRMVMENCLQSFPPM